MKTLRILFPVLALAACVTVPQNQQALWAQASVVETKCVPRSAEEASRDLANFMAVCYQPKQSPFAFGSVVGVQRSTLTYAYRVEPDQTGVEGRRFVALPDGYILGTSVEAGDSQCQTRVVLKTIGPGFRAHFTALFAAASGQPATCSILGQTPIASAPAR